MAEQSGEIVITAENLDVWYEGREGRFRAVTGATLKVEKGAFFGLVGGSGSGKSTVLRVLAGLSPHFAGLVEVGGFRLRPEVTPSRAFRRKAQMVFQDPFASLNPRHTIDRAIGDGLVLHGFSDVDARILRLLDQVGLGKNFRFRYPHELSGGQRQRVAIARALALEPEILLLDEPTSALDASVQAEILNLLSTIRRDTGLTALLVTHDLGVVAHLCDRVSVMQKGAIIEEFGIEALARPAERKAYTQDLIAAAR
ncbi:MAG: ABC transporter ATP-binding protein [Proteobacteria bacterium]|nr:ABC transporter ATP-binding protein [Pseudomonadota bacterium]